MVEVAVVGTGVAGVSAVLTLKALGKSFIWLGSPSFSPKIAAAECIRNYPGLPSVTGREMQAAFRRQTEEMDIAVTPGRVTGIYPAEGHYSLLCGQEMFDAETVILCTGVESVRPIPGETEFMGRGVSSCAVCDGFLYKDKTIAAVCTSKEEEQEILYLASLAQKVFLLPLYKAPAAMPENVAVVRGMPLAIKGERKAEKLVLADREIAVDGIFMLRQSMIPSALLAGLETSDGHIAVDRSCATNLSGCFAAGDCTGRPYQYAKAVGEGNVAAHSAAAYLAQRHQ